MSFEDPLSWMSYADEDLPGGEGPPRERGEISALAHTIAFHAHNSDGTMRFYQAVSGSTCVTVDGQPPEPGSRAGRDFAGESGGGSLLRLGFSRA